MIYFEKSNNDPIKNCDWIMTKLKIWNWLDEIKVFFWKKLTQKLYIDGPSISFRDHIDLIEKNWYLKKSNE